jgi:hypothetical protein
VALGGADGGVGLDMAGVVGGGWVEGVVVGLQRPLFGRSGWNEGIGEHSGDGVLLKRKGDDA